MIVIVASAAIPLAVAWRQNRGWTIRHALAWSWLAWLSWLGFAAYPSTETAYASLSFTGAAGVAVLGARRPGVVAWNFIVASLLIVLWLGWAEGLLSGSRLQLSNLRLLFVAGLLAVTLLNYLMTISGPAALLLGIGCCVSLIALWKNTADWSGSHSSLVGYACWLDWFFRKLQRRVPHHFEFNQQWMIFRNRYGAVWSERVREQFNAAARHKKLALHLGWYGISGWLTDREVGEGTAVLLSITRRFRSEGEVDSAIAPDAVQNENHRGWPGF